MEKLYRIKEASEILGVHPRLKKVRVVKTVGGKGFYEIKRLLGEEVKRIDEIREELCFMRE